MKHSEKFINKETDKMIDASDKVRCVNANTELSYFISPQQAHISVEHIACINNGSYTLEQNIEYSPPNSQRTSSAFLVESF